ncbi:MAG TPA: sigma-70 family RNA polymerase sigma factor, partial [Kofleriaceae bacterium]
RSLTHTSTMPLGKLFNRPRSAESRDWQAAREGDRAAIARFYDANVDGLYAFVFYRVGRDATLAEDVVQETFTAALGRTVDYDPERGSVGSWLASLSRNVIRDHLREHRRADQLLATWERIDATLAQTFAAMAEKPLPGEVLERAETRDLVHMAIANLPEQYRSALTRKYVDGETLETLAGELGISVDAAKSLLARARRAFRDTFAALTANFSEAV